MAIGRSKIKVPRKIKKGDVIKVQCIVVHPMETGRAKDRKTGKLIPAYYINSVKVEYGGEEISHFNIGAGISKNPFFSFYVRADKEAPLKMTFKDIKGGVYEKSVDIRFSA